MEKPIGQVIKEVHARSGMKLNVFAKRIGTTRQNVYKIFERDSIGTARLETISRVLEYDFFRHFSERLERKPEEALPNRPADPAKSPERNPSGLRRELDSALERIHILETRLNDKEQIIELLRKEKDEDR